MAQTYELQTEVINSSGGVVTLNRVKYLRVVAVNGTFLVSSGGALRDQGSDTLDLMMPSASVIDTVVIRGLGSPVEISILYMTG